MSDEIQVGMSMLAQLPLVEAPEEIWASIERSLDAPRAIRAQNVAVLRWSWAGVCAVILLVASWWVFRGQNRWIETGATSRAALAIGSIGTVEIEPNSRVRILIDKANEHRLRLAHGGIHAKISAPPRLFFVETASGTATDLGCEYALHMDENGFGELRVTKGWVSFEWKGIESLVPAGASCKITGNGGPGIPSFDDAANSFKQALEAGELDSILERARVRDTLSLWHLLARVNDAERARVYDRIAMLTRLPASISREKALKLDPQTLTKLKEELVWTW